MQPWYITPNPSFKSHHAIIIGGGLAGTSAAYSLAKRGWKITLIERNQLLASEASGNPVGIVAPMLSHKNDLIGEFYFEGFLHALKHIQAIDIQYQNCGVLDISSGKTDKNPSDLVVPENFISKLSAVEASKIADIPIKANGLFIQPGGFISPSDLCKANIKSDNIKVVYSAAALSINKEGEGWQVATDKENLHSSVVIFANSTDAKNFFNWLPIYNVRGQVTYLPQCSLNPKTVICYDKGYITPEYQGVNYIGATFIRSDNKDISLNEHEENLKNLSKNFHIDQYDITKLEGRVSLRAISPDRRPVIGQVPDYTAFLEDYAGLKNGRQEKYPPGKYLKGLYLTTAHGSRGLTSAPIAGELLVAQINNEELPLPENIVNALSPARFLINELKRT
ncbi:MAG: bifunctional tRNA (5-methylaminomethyl-2-thiouridine)(34)-methyltransferase MnmD/FAD-dependent [Rickettsiaceae bacterium]|jgi:tRNA 5-methylaminomethyl-2-thiouridine biosynthesis bifunctional protein|nr:bifunctional tRNA (5-methylaminomethyl-2-thiouridine)(34)-methyltransferase MnmD/FAD-dependent [Rickettsiaceae bacterium]